MKKFFIIILGLFINILIINKTFAAEVNPISYSGSSVIYKNSNSILLSDTIAQLIRMNFKSDNDIALSIVEDNYSGHGTTLGDYIIKFKATDGTNEFLKDIKISVVIADKFNYYFDNNFYIFNTQIQTKSDLIEATKSVGLIPNVPCNANVNSDYFVEELDPEINLYDYDCTYISATGLSGSFKGKICLSELPIYDNMDVVQINNNSSNTILSILGCVLVVVILILVLKKVKPNKRMFK